MWIILDIIICLNMYQSLLFTFKVGAFISINLQIIAFTQISVIEFSLWSSTFSIKFYKLCFYFYLSMFCTKNCNSLYFV